MDGLAVSPWSVRFSGRVIALLAAVAVLLTVAFVLVPGVIAGWGSDRGIGDEGELRSALRVAFVGYWGSGVGDFSPALGDVVDYWFRYHVVKALIAVVLFGVLVVSAAGLWDAFARESARGWWRRGVLGAAGVGVTVFALVALVAVLANVQGAVAPYASVLPMLVDGGVDPELAGVLDQVSRGLADSGGASPALEVMIGDFSRYHSAMAVIAGVAAVVFGVLSVVLWKRRVGMPAVERRVLGSFGVVAVGLAVVFLVVAVANTTTVADPVPALRALFDGGW